MARSISSGGKFRFLFSFILMAGAVLTADAATTPNASLASSTNPSTLAAQVTLTATVTDPATTTPPTGTITFKDGGALIGSATLVPGGGGSSTATFATSVLSVASHALTFAYSGDGNFMACDSTVTPCATGPLSVTQAVDPRTTTTVIAVTSPVTVRSASAVTATVSDQTFGASSGTSTVTGNNLTINRFGHSAT